MGQGSTPESRVGTQGGAVSWVVGLAGTAAVAGFGAWVFLIEPLGFITLPLAKLYADLRMTRTWAADVQLAATWAAIMLVVVWATASVFPRLARRLRPAAISALLGVVLATGCIPASVVELSSARAAQAGGYFTGAAPSLPVFPLGLGLALIALAAILWHRARDQR